jgi:hypothetical protein
MIGSSRDIVCDLHCTRGGDEKCRFSGLASTPVVTVCYWFGLKIIATVSWVGSQNQGRQFSDLALKITTMVS